VITYFVWLVLKSKTSLSVESWVLRNLGTDGPTDRTGNRVPRSGDQYSLRSLPECDARWRPAGLRAWWPDNTQRNIHPLLEQYLFS
jgi:hypothetical protein